MAPMNGYATHPATGFVTHTTKGTALAPQGHAKGALRARGFTRGLSLVLGGLLLVVLSFAAGFFKPTFESSLRPALTADVSAAHPDVIGTTRPSDLGSAQLQQQQQQQEVTQDTLVASPGPEQPEEHSLEDPEGQHDSEQGHAQAQEQGQVQGQGQGAEAAGGGQAEGPGSSEEGPHQQPEDLPGKPLEGVPSDAEEASPSISLELPGIPSTAESAAAGAAPEVSAVVGRGSLSQAESSVQAETGAVTAGPVTLLSSGTPEETSAATESGPKVVAPQGTEAASASAGGHSGGRESGVKGERGRGRGSRFRRRLVVGESSGQGLGRVVDVDVLDSKGDSSIPPFPRVAGDVRVAVCLVGGARDSDLTIPAIIKHLLTAYPNTHVFIHSPLDQKSYKLLSFAWAPPSVRIGAVRVFSNWWVDERAYPRGMINDINSPKGNQGMFQYFRLVEGCIPLIAKFEKAHGMRFNWIVRTRVDTFWRKPPPRLAAYHAGKYTIPFGTDCYGRNDRMGVGTWLTSRPALARLGMLRRMHEQHPKWADLNSEKGFQGQMLVAGVPFARTHFWFCVVARRVYKVDMMPVVSMASAAPLNGAKCRPCTPQLRGRRARSRLVRFNKQAQLGGIVHGVDLCNARLPWEHGWERVFDRDMGPKYARQRQQLASASFAECVQGFESLKARASVWDAPSSRALCLRRALGPMAMVGGPTTSFGTFWAHLKATGLARTASTATATPRTVYVALHAPENAPVAADATATVGTAAGEDSAEGSSQSLAAPWGNSVVEAWRHSLERFLSKQGLTLQVQVTPIERALQAPYLSQPLGGSASSTAPRVGGQALDVVVVAGSDGDILGLVEGWVRAGGAPAVCQLLVAFEAGAREAGRGGWEGEGSAKGPLPAWEEATRVLVGLGFWLDSCIRKTGETVERCTLFSLHHCPTEGLNPPAPKLVQQPGDGPALPEECNSPAAFLNPRRRKYCSVSVRTRAECPACPPYSRCGSPQRWCCSRYMCICEGRHTTPIYDENNKLVQCIG